MAYTLRNVSRLAHTPLKEKLLNGETNRGIGSVKKMVRAAAEAKAKQDAANNVPVFPELDDQPDNS